MQPWGRSSKALGFGIVQILYLVLFGSAVADEYSERHRCDEYAAHPADPGRWAEGVADGKVIPGPAVTFCERALKAHPQTPRFRFQLARALAAAGRMSEAEEMLRALDKDGTYPFAGEALAGMTKLLASSPAATATSPDPEVFEVGRYWQSNTLSALYEGDLDALKAIDLGSTRMMGTTISHKEIYLSNFAEGFGPPYSATAPDCIELYDPAVRQGFISRLSASQVGRSNEDALRFSLGAITELTRDLERGGPQAIVGKTQALELFRDRSVQDTMRFRAAHRCGGEVARRVYANLRAYVLGVEGLPSPAVKERRRKAEQTKVLRQRRQEEKERQEIAQNTCMKTYNRAPFCTCIIERLAVSDLPEEDWRTIGRDFRKITTVARSLPGFTKTLSECRR